MKKKLAVLFLLLAALVFIFRFQIKAGLDSSLLLLQLIPGNTFAPLTFLTKAPIVEEVSIESGGRQIKADIWRPKDDNKRRPAAILAYGTDVPKNKPELRVLAESFSRLGFVVLVPDIGELLQTRYVESEVEDFVNLFQFLKNQSYVDTQKVGYVSFCIGSSLALLASEDDKIAKDVDFIFVKSVYVDAYAITRDTVTRTLNDAPVANFWQPQEKLRFVVIFEMTDFAADGGQKKLIRESLLGRVPLNQNQIDSLDIDSEAIYNYLANTDPAKSKDLWDKIPQSILREIEKVSPIVNVDKLRAKVFIMAATSDIYLPYTESLKLFKLLPPNRVEIEEVGFLDESGLNPMVTRKELLQQGWKLYRYFYKAFLAIYQKS